MVKKKRKVVEEEVIEEELEEDPEVEIEEEEEAPKKKKKKKVVEEEELEEDPEVEVEVEEAPKKKVKKAVKASDKLTRGEIEALLIEKKRAMKAGDTTKARKIRMQLRSGGYFISKQEGYEAFGGKRFDPAEARALRGKGKKKTRVVVEEEE